MTIASWSGAYWDSAIKRSQDASLQLPCFHLYSGNTMPAICVRTRLFDANDVIYPRLASQGSSTVAAVLEWLRPSQYEFQRLHGMGELCSGGARLTFRLLQCVPTRLGYSRRPPFPYLVRRLLENGANTSFVINSSAPVPGAGLCVIPFALTDVVQLYPPSAAL